MFLQEHLVGGIFFLPMTVQTGTCYRGLAKSEYFV
jgi:hypothetical protein